MSGVLSYVRHAALLCAMLGGLVSCARVDWPSAEEQLQTFRALQASAPIDDEVIAHAMEKTVGIVTGIDPLNVRNDGDNLILAESPDRAPAVGLGAVVLDGRYVVTAYHVVDKPARPIAIIGRGRARDSRTTAKVFWCLKRADLALLELESGLAHSFSMAARASVGDPVWTTGRQALVGGEIIAAPGEARGQARLLHTSLRLIYGDSGGPLLNREGDLLGVNVGADASELGWLARLTRRKHAFPRGLSIMLGSELLPAVVQRKAAVGDYGADCAQ